MKVSFYTRLCNLLKYPSKTRIWTVLPSWEWKLEWLDANDKINFSTLYSQCCLLTIIFICLKHLFKTNGAELQIKRHRVKLGPTVFSSRYYFSQTNGPACCWWHGLLSKAKCFTSVQHRPCHTMNTNIGSTATCLPNYYLCKEKIWGALSNCEKLVVW